MKNPTDFSTFFRPSGNGPGGGKGRGLLASTVALENRLKSSDFSWCFHHYMFFFSFFCLGSAATMHEHVWTRKGGANHKSFQVKLYPTLGISWNKNMYSLRFLFQKKGLQDLWGLSKSWGTPMSKGFCQRNLRAGFGTIFCTIKIAIPGFTENKGAGTRFSCKWLAASLSCCWLNPGFAEFIFTKRPCACFVVTEQGTSWECKISKPMAIRP